jgi:integrase
MARKIHMLSTTKINALRERGFYADGGGLYLQVAPGGSKSWVFRFKESGKARDMGLGPLHTIPLSIAREKATDCRRLRLDGVDPIEKRRAERAALQSAQAKVMTFDECAEAYLADNQASWRNPKHRQQWKNTLATYASPIIGALPVQTIDTGHVTKILRPIWQEKPETASRVRGRIETVLAWATVHGHRTGDNPARWKGHLEEAFPAKGKVRKVKHHAALPYADMGAFMADLKDREGAAALALQFTILTAARTSETLKAEWSELDLAEKVWTVPAERMKAEREHRVPLSPAALAILQGLPKRGKYLFAGDNAKKPLSEMSMLMLLRRMGRDVTAHGFRSTFKDWARESTSFPNEVSEAALAHVNGDKVEAAYARGDLFEKRRKLMDAWASFCTAPARKGNVVGIGRKAG